jgi:hypothetical protein
MWKTMVSSENDLEMLGFYGFSTSFASFTSFLPEGN